MQYKRVWEYVINVIKVARPLVMLFLLDYVVWTDVP